jgi:hypothetical protein
VRVALLLVRIKSFPDKKIHALKSNPAFDGFWKEDVLAQIKIDLSKMPPRGMDEARKAGILLTPSTLKKGKTSR